METKKIRIIEQGRARYTVVCAERKTGGMPRTVGAFCTEIKRRTGAELIIASYNGEGELCTIRDTACNRIATVRANGTLRELFNHQGIRIVHYGEEGEPYRLHDRITRSSKPMAQCRPNGTVEMIFDRKGLPLADCDETNAIVAIRHVDAELLTEEDEDYAERRALAEERLALSLEELETERERRPLALACMETVREHREAGREIVLGALGARPATVALCERVPYTGYELFFDGETLLLGAHADLLWKTGMDALLATVPEEGDEWCPEASLHLAEVDARIATEIPELRTEEGALLGVYYCGAENFELCYENVTTAEYETYVDTLKRKGFSVYDENKIGDSLFGTYTVADEKAGEAVVFTMHYPGRRRTQIVYGPRGFLPDTAPAEMPETPVQTTFTQLGRMMPYAGEACAPGMAFIVQLADGRFIVIDGGPADGKVTPKIKRKGKWITQPPVDTHDAEDLYQFLRDRTPEGQKPRIAVWFMTHPHGDHTGLANRFLKDYAGKIEIDVAGYNLPDFDSYACCYDAQWEKRCVMPFCEEATELYGAETFVMHSGQRMHLPGCELEVIYTQEDYFPELFASANHLSCAFRMTFADTGSTAVILGDCEKQLCKGMAEAYGAALKSDILQLTHHGSNGGDLDLYRNIDPEFCFWALDGWRFDVRTQMRGLDDGYIFNRYLRDRTIRDRKHYTCDETVTLKV